MKDAFRIILGLCLVLPGPAQAAEDGPEQDAAARLNHPFFVFCHDTHDARKRNLAQQAELIRELGFDGVGHLWLDDLPERLTTLDARNLKLFQVFVRVSIDPKAPKYDPRLAEAVALLEGRDTVLGLLITGGKPSDTAGDERAVAIVREIAELAAGVGLRVVLYPHTGDWLEKTSDAVRVARKVDRKNVGVMFNLCHWLKVDDTRRLNETLEEALPYLFVVAIHGADPPPGSWDRLIQPLGSGAFDVAGLLRKLHRLGYNGPIGLMCYGIGGDAEVHLRQSMEAWKRLAETHGHPMATSRPAPGSLPGG